MDKKSIEQYVMFQTVLIIILRLLLPQESWNSAGKYMKQPDLQRPADLQK